MPVELHYRCPVAEAGGLRDVDGGRHCDTCDRAVHDLTAATEPEARARLDAEGGTTCATVRTDARGRVRFRAAATLLVAACGSAPAPPAPEPEPVLRPVPELPLPPPARPGGAAERDHAFDGLTTGVVAIRPRPAPAVPVRARDTDAAPAEDTPRIRVIRSE